MPTPASWQHLHARSINAFFEGKMDEGRRACDHLLAHPQTPVEYRHNAHENATYYASALSSSPEWTAIDLPDHLTPDPALPPFPWDANWAESPIAHIARDWVSATPLLALATGSLAITREVAGWRDGRSRSLHRLVRLDEHDQPTHLSAPFFLEGDGDEAALTLTSLDDLALISYIRELDDPRGAALPMADLLARLRLLDDFSVEPLVASDLVGVTWQSLLAAPAFVINLGRDTQRWPLVQSRLTEAGFTDIRRFAAVDAFNPDILRDAWGRLGNPRIDSVDRDFASQHGKQGCLLSHVALWQEIIDQQLPYAIVFEDDVLFHSQWRELAPAYFEETPRDFDLLYLHGQVIGRLPDRVTRPPTLCTAAYVITSLGAQRLLDVVLSNSDGVRTIDVMLESAQRAMCNGGSTAFTWYTWNSLADPDLPHTPLPDSAWIRNTGLVFQDTTLGSRVTRLDALPSSMRQIRQSSVGIRAYETPAGSALLAPYDLLSCSAPIAASGDGVIWSSAPVWDAPQITPVVQPVWNADAEIPSYTTDINRLVDHASPRPSGGISSPWLNHHVIMRIRLRRTGDLVLRTSSACVIRHAGRVVAEQRRSHALAADPIVLNLVDGDVLDIALWCGKDGWSLAVDAAPISPDIPSLDVYLPAVLRRLESPDGPPLVLTTDGLMPNRLALAVYSLILNGFAPSAVEIYGEHRWPELQRQRINELLPFARIVPTTQFRQRVRDSAGPTLDRPLDEDVVFDTAVLLLGGGPEACCITDDLVVLEPLTGALKQFRGADLVGCTTTTPADLQPWIDLLDFDEPSAAAHLAFDLFFRRATADPADLLLDLVSLTPYEAQEAANDPARMDISTWQRSAIAFCFSDAAIASLPTGTLPDPADTPPGGPFGYDLTTNPDRRIALRFGRTNSLIACDVLIPAVADAVLHRHIVRAEPDRKPSARFFRWDPLRELGPLPEQATGGPVPQHRPSGDPHTYLPDIYAWLCWRFGITSVVDIGCGAAVNLEWFAQNNLRVLGIDGDHSAIAESRIPEHMLHWDYTVGPLVLPNDYDLCLTTEFVEHVEPAFEANWLATVRSCRHLLMSHAVPGQGGYHHVNEQTSDYWITRLAEHGFTVDPDVTAYLRSTTAWQPGPWGRPQLLFFTRDQP